MTRIIYKIIARKNRHSDYYRFNLFAKNRTEARIIAQQRLLESLGEAALKYKINVYKTNLQPYQVIGG